MYSRNMTNYLGYLLLSIMHIFVSYSWPNWRHFFGKPWILIPRDNKESLIDFLKPFFQSVFKIQRATLGTSASIYMVIEIT